MLGLKLKAALNEKHSTPQAPAVCTSTVILQSPAEWALFARVLLSIPSCPAAAQLSVQQDGDGPEAGRLSHRTQARHAARVVQAVQQKQLGADGGAYVVWATSSDAAQIVCHKVTSTGTSNRDTRAWTALRGHACFPPLHVHP
jgi:hypothetical protein